MPTVPPRRVKKPVPREYGDGSISWHKGKRTFIVRVREDGKYRQLGSAATENAARLILEQYHADRAAGLDPSARDWSTVDWLDHWLESKRPVYDRLRKRIRGVEPTTFEKYEMQIRRRIVPYVGTLLAPRQIGSASCRE